MIVLTVAGIMAVLAIPNLNSLFNRMSDEQSADRLINSFAAARNQAVFGGKTIVMCASDLAAADPVCREDQSNWNDGYITYQECDEDFTRDLTNVCDIEDDGTKGPEPLLQTFEMAGFSISPRQEIEGVKIFAAGTVDAEIKFDVTVDGDRRIFTIEQSGKASLKAPSE